MAGSSLFLEHISQRVFSIFVEVTSGERDKAVTISIRCMCCACVLSVRLDFLGYNFYIYAWISNNLAHLFSLTSKNAI